MFVLQPGCRRIIIPTRDISASVRWEFRWEYLHDPSVQTRSTRRNTTQVIENAKPLYYIIAVCRSLGRRGSRVQITPPRPFGNKRLNYKSGRSMKISLSGVRQASNVGLKPPFPQRVRDAEVVTNRQSSAPGLPVRLKLAVELTATQSQDRIGATHGPEHARLLAAGTDSGFDDSRAHE